MKICLFGVVVVVVFILIGSVVYVDDLVDICKKGEIVIGIFGIDELNSFIDLKICQIIGYEVDFGIEIVKVIGVKLVFKQIFVVVCILELQQGYVDLFVVLLIYNKECEVLVDFFYLIIVIGQKVLVKKNVGFVLLYDFDGKKVLMVKGGIQELNICKVLFNVQVVIFEISQQVLLVLQQGKGQVFVDDELVLVNDFGKFGVVVGGYVILLENLSIEVLVIVFCKGNL